MRQKEDAPALGIRRGARRRFMWAITILTLLAAGHAVLWRWAVHRLEAETLAWASARRAQGWKVNLGPMTPGGWPLDAKLYVTGASISGAPPLTALPVVYATDDLAIGIGLPQPRSIVLQFAGQQSLRLGNNPALLFTAGSLRMALPFDPGVPVHEADITGQNMLLGPIQPSVAQPSVAQPGAAQLRVARMIFHADLHPSAAAGEPAVDLNLTAGPIDLPQSLAGGAQVQALGPHVDRLEMDAALSGPWSRAPDPVTRAAGWRDGGGSFTITRMALDWGKLTATGSATLAFDEKLQPMGTATMRLTGSDAALDGLAAAHAVAPQTAFAGKALLGLMAQPQPDGSSVVEVPLTLKDRTLLLGRLPLARLPELVWPTGTAP